MTADDAPLADIIELIKGHTGAKSVTAATRLYADLGMTGDDADGFLQAFAAKYGVDLSGVVWLRYFDEEPTTNDLMEPAITLAACVLSPSFALRWQAARNAEREITIAHLADVARAKVWIHPGEAFKHDRRTSPLVLVFSAMSVLVMAFFVLLGGVVAYAFLAGELGEKNVVVLVGIFSVSLLPLYFAFASWRAIERKLASADGG